MYTHDLELRDHALDDMQLGMIIAQSWNFRILEGMKETPTKIISYFRREGEPGYRNKILHTLSKRVLKSGLQYLYRLSSILKGKGDAVSCSSFRFCFVHFSVPPYQ